MTRSAQELARYDRIKRALDVAVAGIGLILSAPLQLAVALAVAKNLGRPVIFKQDRPGKDEKIFKLYKFRSMKDVDESKGLVTDAQRLTPFGKKLRSTSLDELPSLWNVLKGDMSLVGPRPLRTYYLPLYSDRQRRRHEVRPGVTGMAQVAGRNALSWQQRFEYDVKYVDNRSFWLDLQVVLRTFGTIIHRDGISSETSVTMEAFQGNSLERR